MSRHGSHHGETYCQIWRNVTGLSALQNWVKRKSFISSSWERISSSGWWENKMRVDGKKTRRSGISKTLSDLFAIESPSQPSVPTPNALLSFVRKTVAILLLRPWFNFHPGTIHRAANSSDPSAGADVPAEGLRKRLDDVFPVGWLQNHGWGSQTRGELITEHKPALRGCWGICCLIAFYSLTLHWPVTCWPQERAINLKYICAIEFITTTPFFP